MIILDEQGSLLKELKNKGFEVFDFFENNQVLDMNSFVSLELKRRADFLLVDTQTLLNHPEKQESFKAVLNTFMGAVFFHDHSNEKAQEWVKNEGAFLSKIIGEYSLPMPQLHWTMLSNQLQFFWNLIEDQKKLQRHLARLSVEMDQVLRDAEVEMKKAKKINEYLVPRRKEEIKGVIFSNKYTSGDGGGVEFYDLHQTPAKVYQILLSTDSYLISSALLSILGQHREKDFNPEAFMRDAYAEIETINSARKKRAAFDILLLEMDLVTLQLTQLSNSKAELYSQANGTIGLEKEKTYSLAKGEKLIVFSPGFLFNWKTGHPQKDLYKELKNQNWTSSHEFLSELFIQLKEDVTNEFSGKDATVVMMEVNRHGIHKV
ncbi:MAG: hypothetical protein ACLGHN_03290 [Bacteriovoracia bacterium]